MIGKERHYTGMSDEFLAKYGPTDSLGQKTRHADASQLLEEMDRAEDEVRQRAAEVATIDCRIDHMVESHRLEMDYLVSFGVRAEHREELRQVLRETLYHCRLTLKQAIAIANSRARYPAQSSNGLSA